MNFDDGRERMNLDADPRNADWTKQTLDLYLPADGAGMRHVATVEDMRRWLELSGMTVADFKALPAYTNALRKQPWLKEL
jgi:hypothetical protein